MVDKEEMLWVLACILFFLFLMWGAFTSEGRKLIETICDILGIVVIGIVLIAILWWIIGSIAAIPTTTLLLCYIIWQMQGKKD